MAAITPIVVKEEVAPGVDQGVAVVGQEEVHVVGEVVLVGMVVEVGARVVVLLGEEEVKEEEVMVHRSASLVVTGIKTVVATRNPRGLMWITARSTASRNSSGARTTAAMGTKEGSSGTKILGHSSNGSDYPDWQPFNLFNHVCCP